MALRSLIRQALLIGLLTGIAIATLEGLAGFLLVGRRFLTKPKPLAFVSHTQFDPELGWVSIPNLNHPNRYGRGIGLRTNSQGFRNNREFAAGRPSGKLRVICSGDSFTLGQGVSDGQTWCDDLEKLDGRLETVNMGQSGYGIDQAYLWYKRASASLDHDIHLFAFISDDFRRLALSNFGGYEKPYFTLVNGRVELRNVPVKERVPHKQRFDWTALAEIRTLALLKKLVDYMRTNPAARTERRVTEISVALLDRLNQEHRQKQQRFLAIYLPWQWDYIPRRDVEERREYLKRELASRGVEFLDLTDDLRRLDTLELQSLFIQSSGSHYSVRGHEMMATRIYEHLRLDRRTRSD